MAFPVGERGVAELFCRAFREPDPDLLRALGTLGAQLAQFIERTEAEASVRAGEARKNAMFDAALDAIITMDHEGRILEFNSAAERTFGYTAEQVVGQELAILVPPALRDRHRDGLRRYVATGVSTILGQRLELAALHADGHEFPVDLTITRVELPGDPLFTGYVHDITERRRLAAELREAQKMEALGRLSGGVAHDFNNILAVVRGFADLARRRAGRRTKSCGSGWTRSCRPATRGARWWRSCSRSAPAGRSRPRPSGSTRWSPPCTRCCGGCSATTSGW